MSASGITKPTSRIKKMIHVLTVGHKRFDTRIWIKEISSLKSAGIAARYIVADGMGDEVVGGTEIQDFGLIPERSGFKRRMCKMFEILRNCGVKRGDIVHFHDGIFLPFAFLLRLRGCRIIYDVHEDYPRQVLNSRFPRPAKLVWSTTISLLEWLSGRIFQGFIAATPTIAARFPAHKTVVVQNYPLLEELQAVGTKAYKTRPLNAVFIGGLSKIRGVEEMLAALDLVNRRHAIKLVFGGDFAPKHLSAELASNSGWKFMDAQGFVSRKDVAKLMGDSRMGLVLFHPAPNHIAAQPNKLFEYMSAGIPVIASDFPLWRQIVESSNCGLLVDPLNPQSIADAICWLIEHPKEAEEMGRCGREAVEREYNWGHEEAKLLSFYRDRLMAET